MHLPYVRKVFEGQDIKIVPVLVGAIDQHSEAQYGEILAPFLKQEDTFCVVSSDFCHWGTRFQYTFYYPSSSPSEEGIRLSRSTHPTSSHPIHESINKLDHEAMVVLTIPPGTAGNAHDEFAKYLGRTRNTICGRHPIGVLLGAINVLEQERGEEKDADGKTEIKWVRYEQSSQCMSIRDSSVSYASAWVRF